MTYRATPITQRDGSSLANSNCRMAAIATGLDFDTVGAKKSTGATMRARQSDQAGGTDSGDAVEAWRSYSEALGVRDGTTFDDALAELHAGRLVHLDVWHASVGGPCLSGSGAYGHTLAVAPEFHVDGLRVLVADPWCLPARWEWWPIAKLRAGADEWGRRVYGATLATRAPIVGSSSTTNTAAESVRERVKRLMSEANPESPADNEPVGAAAPETGGPQRILYTVTSAATGGGEAGGSMAIDSRPALGDLAEGVEFFDAPGGTSVGKVSFAQTAEVLGVPMDHSTDRLNLAWRAVWLYTKAINGVASRKVVYVATTGLTNLRPIPAPAVPGPEGEYLPVVTAAQTLYVRK